MRTKLTNPGRRGERGAALVVGLIFLAMLSLMGVAAYVVANQEERMAGNTRDRIRAFEAAEASLRDCEAQVGGTGGLPNFDGSEDGMYEVGYDGSDWVYEKFLQEDEATTVRIIPSAVAGVAVQPRCIIESFDPPLEVTDLTRGLSGPQEKPLESIYRITAMGFGADRNTRVTLQTIFRRPG